MPTAIKYLLDSSNIGSRARVVMLVVFAIATFLLAVLQAALDSFHTLPEWQYTGVTLLWLQAAVSFLGKFTRFGDQIIED